MKLTIFLSLFAAFQLNLAAAFGVSVTICRDENWVYCDLGRIYSDAGCHEMVGTWDNSITGFEVLGGCCAFYRDHGCKKEGFLFFARSRSHSRLPPYDNDIISSINCRTDCNREHLNPHEGGWTADRCIKSCREPSQADICQCIRGRVGIRARASGGGG